MSDRLSSEKRSWNMSRIKSRDTSIELLVRSLLHRAGFRFRKNVAAMPGKPDIVLKKCNTVIFIHGCFWHRHDGCKNTTTPKSNTTFWEDKFRKNIENDLKHLNALTTLGWKVIVLWECELNKKNYKQTTQRLIQQLSN